MFKRITILTTLVLAIASAALAADLKDPKEIISQAKIRLLKLDNYSFSLEKEGWDFDMEKTADATKNLTGEASGSSLTKALTKDVDQVETKGPKWMTYKSEYKFMKPWVLWMKIIKSDYVPPILIDAIMRYNYVKNKTKWSVKAAKVPIGIPRGIDTESGNFLFAGWTLNFISMENLSKDTAPKLAGAVKVNGRDAYKISFDFSKAKPTKRKTDLAAWNVPKELNSKFDEELGWFSENKERIKTINYYIDKKTLDLLKEEVIQTSGKPYYTKQWKDIKVNSLSKKDMG